MMKNLRTKLYYLLRASERYMKTDMVYLAKGGGWIMGGYGFSLVFSFLLAFAFAQLLPKESYGIYKFVLSLVGIIGAFSLSGLGTAVVQSTAQGFDGALKAAIRVHLKWSVLMALIALSGALYYLINENTTLALALAVAAFALPILKSFALYGSFLQGKKDFKTSALFSVATAGITSLVLILSMLLTDTPLAIIVTYFAINVAVIVVLYVLTLRRYRPQGGIGRTTISYGKHFSVMNIFGTVAEHLDKVLIFHYLGAVELAVYAFATIIPGRIRGAFKSIHTLALPKLSQKQNADMKTGIHKKSLRLLGVLVLIAGTYVLAAPYIFTVLFPQYQESIVFSQVFILVIFSVMGTLPSTALKAKGAVRQLHTIALLSSGVQILLLIPLTAFYGLWGALIAGVISKGLIKPVLIYSFFLTTSFSQK